MYTFIAPAQHYVLVLQAEDQVYTPDAHTVGGFQTIKQPGLRATFEKGRLETDDEVLVKAIMANEAFGKDVFLLKPEDLEVDDKDKEIARLKEQLATKTQKPKVARVYTASDGEEFDHPLKKHRHEQKLKKEKAAEAK